MIIRSIIYRALSILLGTIGIILCIMAFDAIFLIPNPIEISTFPSTVGRVDSVNCIPNNQKYLVFSINKKIFRHLLTEDDDKCTDLQMLLKNKMVTVAYIPKTLLNRLIQFTLMGDNQYNFTPIGIETSTKSSQVFLNNFRNLKDDLETRKKSSFIFAGIFLFVMAIVLIKNLINRKQF